MKIKQIVKHSLLLLTLSMGALVLSPFSTPVNAVDSIEAQCQKKYEKRNGAEILTNRCIKGAKDFNNKDVCKKEGAPETQSACMDGVNIGKALDAAKNANTSTVTPTTGNQTCGGVATSIIGCSGDDGQTGVENSGVWSLLLMAITILSAGVGVVALAGIVWGAILYTSAGGNPEQVKKARGVFTNVAIGVIAFAGMYVLLNFIIPGGIFN